MDMLTLTPFFDQNRCLRNIYLRTLLAIFIAAYFFNDFFLRGVAGLGARESVQALVACRVFLAASRLTAAVACALAAPAILLAPLKNMLMNGFFIRITPFKEPKYLLCTTLNHRSSLHAVCCFVKQTLGHCHSVFKVIKQ